MENAMQQRILRFYTFTWCYIHVSQEKKSGIYLIDCKKTNLIFKIDM
jgi:hypothetical protein